MIHYKNILGALMILCMTHLAVSQITITNATFPVAGDTLKTATDNSPDGIVITAPGGPLTWDFSMLTADDRSTTAFQLAADGMASASYPQAELVVIIGAGAETYYDVTATAFSNLGISGSEILSGFPLDADLKFVPPLKERRAPVEYPSVENSQAALSLAIPISALPGGVLDSLGIPSGFIDSIGVRLTTSRADFVDAYGTLSIPGGTYAVLRQKRTDYTDTRLEVYNALLGWQDITDLVGLDGFGKDTTISYQFLSDTEKEPIAVVTMDSSGVEPAFVDYKDNGVTSAARDIVYALNDFQVFPNPVVDATTFSFKNIKAETYTLHVFNASGMVISKKDVTSGFETISMADQSVGVYTYQILNNKGIIVAGGKLVKVNP